jgi:hypothetical protein
MAKEQPMIICRGVNEPGPPEPVIARDDRIQVQAYLRLDRASPELREKIGFLLLYLEPDACLDELEVLVKAIKPAYASIQILGAGLFDYLWHFDKETDNASSSSAPGSGC